MWKLFIETTKLKKKNNNKKNQKIKKLKKEKSQVVLPASVSNYIKITFLAQQGTWQQAKMLKIGGKRDKLGHSLPSNITLCILEIDKQGGFLVTG